MSKKQWFQVEKTSSGQIKLKYVGITSKGFQMQLHSHVPRTLQEKDVISLSSSSITVMGDGTHFGKHYYAASHTIHPNKHNKFS